MLDVVVIEDNIDLNELLVEGLAGGAYTVHGFTRVRDYENSGIRGDVFLLDLNLPEEDGMDFAKRLKEVHPEAGIVVLSARSGTDARIEAYRSGVDTFLRKPCEFDEVLAALSSAARRVEYVMSNKTEGDTLTLSTLGMRLSARNTHVELTEDEVRLIAALQSAPDQCLPYKDIIQLFDPSGQLKLATLEVRIARLNGKLRRVTGANRLIRAIRNTGYKLVQRIALSA